LLMRSTLMCFFKWTIWHTLVLLEGLGG
jgi:hypothetical protein